MTQPREASDRGHSQLRELLSQLHEELRAAQSLDPDTRRLLQELQADTAALLERGEEGGPGRQRLRDRLAAATAGLEGTHPDVALAVAKVADILSGLGI